MRLTKRYENGTFGVADVLPCGENSHDFKQLLINNLGWYEERDLAQSAIETTEILNEVKADKGILTEEELNKEFDELLDGFAVDHYVYQTFNRFLNSHKALFSANAELSFKNMNLQNLITDLNHYANLDHEECTSLKEKIEALEELK